MTRALALLGSASDNAVLRLALLLTCYLPSVCSWLRLDPLAAEEFCFGVRAHRIGNTDMA